MKNIRLDKILLMLALLVSSTSMAAAKNKTVAMCEEMANDAEISRCLDSIRDRKDREMATWINNQSFILEELAENTGRRASLNMFKRSQRNFLSYRENNCRWQYLMVSPAPGAAIAFKKCYITLTQDRIEELMQLN